MSASSAARAQAAGRSPIEGRTSAPRPLMTRPGQYVPPPTIHPALRRRLVEQGIVDNEIQRDIRQGSRHPLARGIYLDRENANAAQWPEDRYRSLIAGVAERLSSETVISHISAAAVWGLPFWGMKFGSVHVTKPVRSGTHRSALVHVHSTTASPTVATVHGIRVTAPARTVVDCARMLDFERAVALIDAALHNHLATPADLLEELAVAARWHGVARARSAVRFGDGLSESVGESRSRVLLFRNGLTPPAVQYEVHDHRGRLIARSDFAYPEANVLVEFDGRAKYGRLLKPGKSAGDAAFEEKLREDALRRLGWMVVRWTWADLNAPEVILSRLRAALNMSRAPLRARIPAR